MLVKHPWLTVVACVAISLGVAVTVGVGVILRSDRDPDLPLPDADRVVTVENIDLQSSEADPRALHDFVVWRESLATIDELGAFATRRRSLEIGDGRADPIVTAEITAAGLPLARERPALGRLLDDADDRPGASRVAVVGYDVWQTRFEGDPDVIGRVVAALFSRFGDTGIVKHIAVVVPLVILFGFVASIVPTRRGLRTRPADALRADG